MEASQRFRFVPFVVAGVALTALPYVAHSQHPSSFDKSSGQGFPSKPIRLVASTTAGSQPDTIARVIAQ